jgi:hypothetical protein
MMREDDSFPLSNSSLPNFFSDFAELLRGKRLALRMKE